MAAPYLLEIRTGGNVKRELRQIIYDVSDRFDVHTVAKPRAVPHITLFGPYNTDQGYRVRDTILDVLGDFDRVPYRIQGFGHFDRSVIYADVIPSKELRKLRRQISSKLRPITYNYQTHDSDRYYEFHTSIARRGIEGKFDEIWEYLKSEYDLECDEYATRITALNNRDMMWEYDVPRNKKLKSSVATSAKSWKKTNDRLNQLKSSTDHDNLDPKPGLIGRLRRYLD